MGNDDVNQATLALKGMLGIGSSAPKSGVFSGGGESGIQSGNKKKTLQSDRQQPRVEEVGREKDRHASKKKTEKLIQQPDATMVVSNDAQNFAWSAFQSSPDASTLPLPAFYNSSLPTSQSTATKEKQPLREEAHSDPLVTHAQDSEAREGAARDAVKTADTSAQVSSENIVTVMLNSTSSAESHMETQTKQTRHHEPPVSSSGIDLAALASLLPKRFDSEQNQKSPTSLHTAHHPLPNNNHNQPDPMAMHQPHCLPQTHASFSSQYPYHRYQQQPPRPHSHVTIQVQVPPVLMPGRQMVVRSPGGYLITVTVPDGVPPGMIVPLTLPVVPLNYSPATMGSPLHTHGTGGNSLNVGIVGPHMVHHTMATPYQQHQHFLEEQYRFQQYQQAAFGSASPQFSFPPQQYSMSSSQQQLCQQTHGQYPEITSLDQSGNGASAPGSWATKAAAGPHSTTLVPNGSSDALTKS